MFYLGITSDVLLFYRSTTISKGNAKIPTDLILIRGQPGVYSVIVLWNFRITQEAYPIPIEGAHVLEHLAQKQHEHNVVRFLRNHAVENFVKQAFIISDDMVQRYKRKFNLFWSQTRTNGDTRDALMDHQAEISSSSSLPKLDDKIPIVEKLPERPLSFSSGEDYLEYMIRRSRALKSLGKNRSLLPPERVGALASRSIPPDDDWLPNYGGTWSTGSRKRTREEFRHSKHDRNTS